MGSRGVDNLALENGDKELEDKRIVRSGTTLSQVDLDILSKQNMVGEEKQDLNLEDSSISNLQLGQFFGQPLGVLNSGSKWNPFRKTSGIMNVMHAQSKRNRMVSKHGRINTYNRSTDQQERLLKDFFTSMIDLS